MPTIFLIRHAEPVSPHEWGGGDDTRPLSDKGRRQAQWMADYLRDKGVTGIHTSPLARCVETAAIIGEATGIEPRPDRRLHIWEHFAVNDIDGTQIWVAHSNNIPDAVYSKGVSCMSCAHASAWRLDLDENGKVTNHEYIVPED